MSTTPTSERTPDATKPGGRNLRWLWVVALIVVIVAAGIALAWLAFSGDEEPTVAFDGQTATYSGPTSLAAGEITFTFDATEYDSPNGVMFIVAKVTDDSITLEDLEALAATEPASGPIPPFIGTFENFLVRDEVVEVTYTLSEGRWMTSAHTSPQDTDRVYPAAILEVTSD